MPTRWCRSNAASMSHAASPMRGWSRSKAWGMRCRARRGPGSSTRSPSTPSGPIDPGETTMDMTFSPEEEAFRTEVRTFLAEKYPKRLADKVRKGMRLTKADQEEWQAILNERGWL